MESRRQRSRADTAAGIVYLTAALALQAWAVWVMLPPQQRMWIRLAAAGRARQLAAATALRLGYLGMGEELRTGQRSLRYLAAWGMSTARDRAHRLIEDMRP